MFWTITTDAAEIVVSSLLDSQPAPTTGKTGTWSLKFHPDSRTPGHVERYEQLMAYKDYAGAYASDLTGAFEPFYVEQHGGASLLVALEPPAWDETGRGAWGLIDAIDDSTEVPEKQCLVDLDMLYLADRSEYDTHEDVRSALEVRGI